MESQGVNVKKFFPNPNNLQVKKVSCNLAKKT